LAKDAQFNYFMSNFDKNYWQKGLNFALELCGWLVGPLVVALFLGDFLDQKYQTAPRYFWILVGLAFAITIIGLAIETIKYTKELEKESKNNKAKANDSITKNK